MPGIEWLGTCAGGQHFFRVRSLSSCWIAYAGAKFLTNEEAQMVGELNMRHSHATHDLYNRIRDGNFPEWTWYVQTMPVETNPADIGFDPLDDTKV